MSLVGNALLAIQRIGAEFKSVRNAISGRVARSDAAGFIPNPVEWIGAATTLADGTWTVSFPAGLFVKPPLVFAQAVSPDKTVAATYVAAPWPATANGCSGHVVSGNVITTLLVNAGANGLKLSASGVSVSVRAVSVR
uniref:Minor tail protein n=1 Tax=Pseudomonas phage Touem01 TaxID=3138548 RepID=A0AAU6W231_9VIRU